MCVLYANRKHLHDESSPRNHMLRAQLGGLFLRYEKPFWWFEVVPILVKMAMTGLLCLVAPGSPVQLLCAAMIMALYTMGVLRLAPFKTDADDTLSFCCSIVLVLVFLGAILLQQDQALRNIDGEASFDPDAIGWTLITLSLLCLLLHVACLVLLKFKLWDRCAGRLETQCCPCLAGKRSGGENDGAGEDNAGTGSGGAAPSQPRAVGQSRPPRRSLGDASMRRMLLRKVASRKATRLEDLAQVHILAHTQKIKARQIDARARLQRRILKVRSSAATVTETRKGKGKGKGKG